tara:strand:- start:1838 stop:2092 length:255 start_codon:yes stop_codon:yes gene_type:complete
MNDKEKKVMDRVSKGDYKVQPHFPEEVKVAVESFFKATEMMLNEELDHVPAEYLGNLLKTLAKYPEYNKITLDLIKSMKEGDVI